MRIQVRDRKKLGATRAARAKARSAARVVRSRAHLGRRRRRLRDVNPWLIVAAIVVAAGAFGLASQMPELRRYQKMRRM